jgi:hypothetical protein
VDNAKTIVCLSDGAAWIWAIAFMCFAVRVESLDWWRAVQRLWTIANTPSVQNRRLVGETG